MSGMSRCETMRRELMETTGSSRLGRLLTSLQGKVFSSCSDCQEANQTFAYLADKPLEVVLCTSIRDRYHMEGLLMHELTHAYDYVNNRCDFNSCEGLAYTEVRAASAGNCREEDFFFTWTRENCIKDQAAASTAIFHGHKRAVQCVDQVFEAAMQSKDDP